MISAKLSPICVLITMATANKVLHVVAAAIFNKQGDLLIAQRPLDKYMVGLWEFPGGKVEAGEAVTDNLCRELDEKLGIHPLSFESLISSNMLIQKNSSVRCQDRQGFWWRSLQSRRASRKMNCT